VILNIGLAGLHLHFPHPSRRQVRHAAERSAFAASCAGWVCVAVTAVGFGYGRLLAVTLTLTVVAYAGYLVGAHRANAVWSARHRRVLEALQRAQSATQRETARRLAELSVYAAADREPHMARKDRHVNRSHGRVPAGHPLDERSR
jgi:hypothetical protein